MLALVTTVRAPSRRDEVLQEAEVGVAFEADVERRACS